MLGTIDLTGTTDYLDTTTNGNINYGESSAGGVMRINVVQSTDGNVMLTVPHLSGGGQNLDLIATAVNGLISALGTVLIQVGDNMTTVFASMITAGISITIDGDYDNTSSNSGSIITINGSISSPLTDVNAGTQDDQVFLNYAHGINTQSTAVVSTFTNAVVNVDGQAGMNALTLSDSSFGGSDRGAMTLEWIAGLGMGGLGVHYTNFQSLVVELSQGGDTFTVISTHVNCPTLIFGGAGSDFINVGASLTDDVPMPGSPGTTMPHDQGNLNAIQGMLTFNGNGGSDSLEVDDHGQLYAPGGQQQYATNANGKPILTEPLHQNDDGPPATDTLDPAYGYNYIVTPDMVVNDPATITHADGTTSESDRPLFAGVVYNATGSTQDSVTFLRLDGTDRTNRFAVTPSQTTSYLINGISPNSSCRIDGGDYLQLNTSQLANTFARNLHLFTTPNSFSGTIDGTHYYPDLPAAAAGDTTGQTVPPPGLPPHVYPQTTPPGVDAGILASPTGNGYWDFTRGGKTYAKPVYFLSIEQFNHVAITAQVSIPPPNSNQVPYVTVRDAETGDVKFVVVPYESYYHGGINVAVGDLSCDGIPDLAVIPEAGHDAQVEIYNGSPNALGQYTHKLLNSFLAFPRSFLGGGSVAIGDVNHDGENDLIVGAGQGYVPVIEVYNGDTVLNSSPSLLGKPFYAFNSAFGEAINQNFRGGVNVAVGDLQNNGYDNIVATPASNGPPIVNVFRGKNYAFMRGFNAFRTSNFPGGLSLAVGDVTGDGVPDVVVGSSPGYVPEVAVFSGASLFSSPVVTAIKTIAVAPLDFRGAIVVQTEPDNGGNPGTVELDAIFAELVPNEEHGNVANELFETITAFEQGGGRTGR